MYLYTYLYFNNIIAHNSHFERCRKMEKRIQAISAAIYINGENWGVYRNWDSYKINNLENWKNLAQNQTSSVQHSQNRELYLIMENTVTINNNHILFNIQLIFPFKIHLSLIDIQNLIMKFSFSSVSVRSMADDAICVHYATGHNRWPDPHCWIYI